MANQLKKLAEAVYTPAVVGQPYVPAYCEQIPYTTGGYQSQTTTWILNEDGQYVSFTVYGRYIPPTTTYREVCYPSQPAIQSQPATTTYTAITGWNGGARSVGQIDRDGYFEFQANSGCHGISVGFSSANLSQLPSEPTHSLYLNGTTISVMESGYTVHTAGISHTYANVYRIERRGQPLDLIPVDGHHVESARRQSGQ